MDPTKAATLIVEVIAGLVVVGVILWLVHGAGDLIQAPAKLEAAVGANAALAEGAKAQNAGVDRLQAASKARKAESESAVKAAGAEENTKAAAITAKAATGDTPLARAANRINTEFAQ